MIDPYFMPENETLNANLPKWSERSGYRALSAFVLRLLFAMGLAEKVSGVTAHVRFLFFREQTNFELH